MCCNAAVTIREYSCRSSSFSLEAHGNSGCCAKTGADRAGEIHPSATGTAGSQPRLSRRADRRGRYGRLRKKHAIVFAEALAGDRGLPATFHRMEFVSARKICDAAGQTAAITHANFTSGDEFHSRSEEHTSELQS